MQGSPQYLFLRQPARVELLVDGRLVDSRYYEAGNNILDTSALPSGSYDLVLRVQEGGGPVREERRFFVRSAEMAPLGRPLFHAVAGVLASTAKGRPVNLQRQFYFSAGANIRLNQAIGVEAGVSGTQGKLLGQGGLFLMTRFARLRASALQSTDGDRGALLQLASADLGPLQFTVDLRRVHSRSGEPLLPQTGSGESFGGPGSIRARPLVGSYTQLTGNAALQLGPLDLQLTGYFRGDGPARDYSVGPSLAWRLVQLPGMQFTMLADAQKTAGGLSGFFGGRLVMVRGGVSTVSSGGTSLSNPRGNATRRRTVGSVTSQWDVQPWEDARLSLAGGINRELSGTSVTGSASLHNRYGTARADLNRRLGEATGYSLSIQSGGAVTDDALVLGGRELAESALVASVRGRAGAFELLVDGIPRGRLKGGGSLPLFLAPYRSYSVQLRPLDGGAIDFDPSPRTVTLYPGNVEHAVWEAQRLVTLYGRLVDSAGQPLAGARVDGAGSDAVSGADGWFQFDRPAARLLAFVRPDGSRCTVPLPAALAEKPYLSLGTVTCS